MVSIRLIFPGQSRPTFAAREMSQLVQNSLGSGVIVSKEGHIITEQSRG